MSNNTALPFLPGYNVSAARKDRYPKPHTLELINGVRVDNARDQALAAHATNAAFNQINPLAITNTKDYKEIIDDSKLNQSNSYTMNRLPAWVAYDRKVLRFYGYFREAVHSSPVETWRIRKCVLYFYLEDDSIHIAEPRIENSGIPQGVFVKRHRIPKPDSNEFFAVDDLFISAELNIYGRVFRLVDCDNFTREFYAKNGSDLGEPETYPTDPFTKRHTYRPATHHKLMHQHKLFMEASLGKHIHPGIPETQKFLTNDGKVLRFYCQWDDDKMYGEIRPYILHYYLADDTAEVQEIQTPNSGRDPFPTLLKRQKLPVNWTESTPDLAKIGSLKDELNSRYYNERDLKVGTHINVYGRSLFICGADEFTKQYYIKTYGMTEADFPRLNMEDKVDTLTRMEPPPHNGFGSEEDSLGSFLFLMPKVPRPDFKKLYENDGLCIRFMARFVNPSKVDKDRRFIVTYYLAHDQVSIFEKFERNSGFIGGKFLERQRLKNPATGEYFHPSDFYVGAKLSLNTHSFELLECDEYTRKFMQSNPQIFKISNQPDAEKEFDKETTQQYEAAHNGNQITSPTRA